MPWIVLGAELVEDTLRYDHAAVGDAHDLALDDGGYCQADDLVDGGVGLVEHLGDNQHGIVA